MSATYAKHFLPLESNPEVFNRLIRSLGSPPCLEFQDVLSLDDADLLPHPAIALILIFPTTDIYEDRRLVEDATRSEYECNENEDDIIWFMQTINNACGLYGILHALSNGPAREIIEKSPQTFLTTLISNCSSLSTHQRSSVLETSVELERVYGEVAVQGASRVPESAEDEVDYHFVCFVRSHKSGHLYELDGDRKGPIDRGLAFEPEEDMLGAGGLSAIREYLEREQDNGGFGLIALVHTCTTGMCGNGH